MQRHRGLYRRTYCYVKNLFFGASQTVELAPFSISRTVVSNFWVWLNFYDCILVPKEVTGYKIIYLCSKSIKFYDFQACHYNFFVANHVVFVSILDPPKNRLCKNLVFYHVCCQLQEMPQQLIAFFIFRRIVTSLSNQESSQTAGNWRLRIKGDT